MTIEQMKEIFENYETLRGDLSRKANKLVKSGIVKSSPFFHGSWSFSSIDFDKNTITFEDDDFYNGYDLHDMTYIIIPLSLFIEDKVFA